jgi:hypothetical protein
MADDLDFELTPIDHDPFDLSEQADLTHTLGEGLVQVGEPCIEAPAPAIPERVTLHIRSGRGDQPSPQAHQLSLARHPGLQEDMFEVGFRRRPGDAERCGGLDQRAPGEQAGEHLGFGRRQTKGGSQGVGTILRVRWRTDEYGGNGCGLQSRAEIAPGEWQDVSEDGRYLGLAKADRQPRLANAGLVPGRKGEGGAQLRCG